MKTLLATQCKSEGNIHATGAVANSNICLVWFMARALPQVWLFVAMSMLYVRFSAGPLRTRMNAYAISIVRPLPVEILMIKSVDSFKVKILFTCCCHIFKFILKT